MLTTKVCSTESHPRQAPLPCVLQSSTVPFHNAPHPSPPRAPGRSIFDIDNIDIGPERRAYLETKLERVWEINSEGSIPWCVGTTVFAVVFCWLSS